MQSKAEVWKDFWEAATPLWMFRSRPDDFPSSGYWVCPGLFWLPGLIAVFTLHVACFAVFFTFWFKYGYQSRLLVCLVPLLALWLVFVAADVKFRLQRPTRSQRQGFDNAVLNWCGFIVTVVGYCVGVPALVVSLLWQLWQRSH